ncbi:Zinc finger MYM-type protein 1 [Frankliniella fusca]|uniref:Zinc finger MYM-type protein 1 n=1 Tax=Frankliniella fusca TaxID=407009 RepID=A0AAE1HPA9_9NEOP|nr:Zinc finger MYM-type protein 1 [Frankliniella fusca]
MKLGNLVKNPLTKFAKLLGAKGELEMHASHEYHHAAVERGREFLRSQHAGRNIHDHLDSQHSKEVAENHERLMCSLENVIFLGRQGLALRGHRENKESGNRGNFLELMTFRQSIGDEKVNRHLSSTRKRDLYRSAPIQNDLIHCCGEVITDTIVDRVRQNKFYSLLFDETTDISHMGQLSLSVRYPYLDEKKKMTVREDFLTTTARASSHLPSARASSTLPTARASSTLPTARASSTLPTARASSHLPSARASSPLPTPYPPYRIYQDYEYYQPKPAYQYNQYPAQVPTAQKTPEKGASLGSLLLDISNN